MVLDKALLLARGAGSGSAASRHAGAPAGPSLASLPVGNRPLFEHHLETLGKAGAERIAVACDPDVKAEVDTLVERRGSRSAYVRVFERRGASLADAVFGAREIIGRAPFILHLGESLVRSDLADLLGEPSPAPGDSVALIHRPLEGEPQRKVAGARAFREASTRPVGIYLVGSGFVEALAAGDPRPIETEIAAALERMTLAGGNHRMVEVEAWRWAPGSESLLQANRFALAALEPDFRDASLEGSSVEGAVRIHHSARVERSVVRGPAIIGAGVRVRESYVGPFTALAEGVELVGSEIENSVVLRGSRLAHIGARIDSSVIGPRARISREFRMPKAMQLEVGASAEIKLS